MKEYLLPQMVLHNGMTSTGYSAKRIKEAGLSLQLKVAEQYSDFTANKYY
jgi:hypothetical protein